MAQSGGTPELESSISDILENIGVRWDGSIHSLVALYGMLGDFSQESDDRMVISMNQGIQDLYNKEVTKSSMNFEDIEGEALRSRARDRATEEAFLSNRRRATSTERRTIEGLARRAAGRSSPVLNTPVLNTPVLNTPALRNPRLRWTIIVALTFLLPVMFNRLPSSNNSNNYTPAPTPFSSREQAREQEQRQQREEQQREEQQAHQQEQERERAQSGPDLARQQLRDDSMRFNSPMKHLKSLIPAVPTKSDLDGAFHLLTLIHHPDKPGGDPVMFMKLVNARKDLAAKFNLKRRPD